MDSQRKEVIVYAWASFTQRNIGGRSLPSSMDTYGEEYGWTSHDFAVAAGGTLVNFYTIGINALVPETGQDIPLAIRYERLPNVTVEEEGDISTKHPLGIVQGYPADGAILFRHEDRLLDVGLYGVFDTLTGKKLSDVPTMSDELLDIDGPFVFFSDYHHANAQINVIDLREALATGELILRPATGKRAERSSYRKEDGWLNAFYGARVLKARTFHVGNRRFIIDNAKMDDWFHVAKSSIVDMDGKVLQKGHPFQKYIVDAIGFPAGLIPQLAEHHV